MVGVLQHARYKTLQRAMVTGSQRAERIKRVEILSFLLNRSPLTVVPWTRASTAVVVRILVSMAARAKKCVIQRNAGLTALAVQQATVDIDVKSSYHKLAKTSCRVA